MLTNKPTSPVACVATRDLWRVRFAGGVLILFLLGCLVMLVRAGQMSANYAVVAGNVYLVVMLGLLRASRRRSATVRAVIRFVRDGEAPRQWSVTGGDVGDVFMGVRHRSPAGVDHDAWVATVTQASVAWVERNTPGRDETEPGMWWSEDLPVGVGPAGHMQLIVTWGEQAAFLAEERRRTRSAFVETLARHLTLPTRRAAKT